MARKIVSVRSGGFYLTESAVDFTGTTKTIVAAPLATAADARRWITDPTYPLPTEVFTVEIATLAMDAIITVVP